MAKTFDAVHRVRDASEWTWYSDQVARQQVPFGSPGAMIPADFDAVVRVMHPASDGSTWAQVALESGRVAHPLMQWTHIEGRCGQVRGHNTAEILAYGDRLPALGDAPAVLLEAVLGATPAQSAAYFGVWEGCGGWDHPDEADLLEIPQRRYRVFRGPMAAHQWWPGMTEHTAVGQSAHLIWPADRSWLIATDVDWMWTFVAGATMLTDALLDDPRIEAYPVAFDSPLHSGSDRINPSFRERQTSS